MLLYNVRMKIFALPSQGLLLSAFNRFLEVLNAFLRKFKLGGVYPSSTTRLDKWHLDFITFLAQLQKPNSYLEIGVHHAGLFNKVLPFANSATAVDINPNAKKYISKNDKVTFYNLSSNEFWEMAKENNFSFDLIFVDGDHSKNQVKIDFHNSLELLSPEGLLLMHDTYPLDIESTIPSRCGDGYLAITEIGSATSSYELVTLPFHPGLTIVRKRTSQVPWETVTR